MKKVWILHTAANADSDDFETKKLVKSFEASFIKPIVFQPKHFDIITSRKSPKSIRYMGETVKLPDAVLVRTGSGTNYFTLALLRQLEGFDVPVINSSDSIIKAKDKMLSSQLLASAKIPTPRTMLVTFPVNIDVVEEEIGFPCVVKVISGSKGKGVYLCQTKKFFEELMELVQNLNTKKSLLIQKFIDSGEIFDLRVWVVNGKAHTAMKRVPPKGDFRANISAGGHGEPFKLTEEIASISEAVAKTFGLELAGVDLLFDGEKYLVCEANSSPGFEGINQYCKTDMSTEIVKYVKGRL